MMIRKVFFWLHLVTGVAAGLFIFIMSATGVLLSFERQMIQFADRDIRSISAPANSEPKPLNKLLELVRHAHLGDPNAIVVRNELRASAQFTIGRNKTVYVDPYSGAVLGVSSATAHDFFSAVERLHRALGSPLGSKGLGHWLTAISNLLFCALIVLGVFLWLPRQWNWRSIRNSIAFRTSVRGKAREWNWHNVIGVWCALPLLVIALTGVVMSFPWANALLFRVSGSAPPANGRDDGSSRAHMRNAALGSEPNYDVLFVAAKKLEPSWRTITLNVVHDPNVPVSAAIDTGNGGQPQARTQFLLNRETGAIVKSTKFSDGSLGQRLRAFVRFGHTGEWGGPLGQVIATIATLGACVLVYTGLSLAIRRLSVRLQRKRRDRMREVLVGVST